MAEYVPLENESIPRKLRLEDTLSRDIDEHVPTGLVYKDLGACTVDYASYSSAIVIDPNQTDRNRVIEPVTEPLFTLNGRPQWLTLGMPSNVVLEVGDRVSLGAGVIPPVPAEVEITLTRPDGSTVERHGRVSVSPVSRAAPS